MVRYYIHVTKPLFDALQSLDNSLEIGHKSARQIRYTPNTMIDLQTQFHKPDNRATTYWKVYDLMRGGLHSTQLLIKFIDTIIIVSLMYLITYAYKPEIWNDTYFLYAIIAALLYTFLSEITNSHLGQHSAALKSEFFITSLVWFFCVLLTVFFQFLAKDHFISRIVLITWTLLAPVIIIGWRYLARRIVRAQLNQSKTRSLAVIAGAGMNVRPVRLALRQNPWQGYQYTGIYEDRISESRHDKNKDLFDDLLGDFNQLIEDAKNKKFDAVFIVLPMEAQVRIMTIIDKLANTTVSAYIVPDSFLNDLIHSEWQTFAGMPVISIYDTPYWGFRSWVKKIEDMVLASIILLLISIPMLAVAILIKLTSRGPVLFKQRRYGIDGKEILVYKFRTMKVLDDGKLVVQAKKGDSRITTLGAKLRKTSIDELPQFFNVLQGTMSIVGPRPHAVAHNEEYRGDIRGYMLRHKIKPGITGWAQINGWRGETDSIYKMEKRVEYDLWYLNNASLWLDLKIIFISIFKGFGGKNAY